MASCTAGGFSSRAADAGQEVKALAAQTAMATGEISAQIAGMQTTTQASFAAIKEIGDTIGRTSEIATAIAAAVEQQGTTTAEIARNVQEAAQGTTQGAANVLEVNKGANQTGPASVQVLSAAQSLARESHHLEAEVDAFLQRVRVA